MNNPFKPTSNVTFGTPTPAPTSGGDLTPQQQQYISDAINSMNSGVQQFSEGTKASNAQLNADLEMAEKATLEHSKFLQNYSQDVVSEATRVPMERLASQRAGGMLGLSLQAQNARNMLAQNTWQSEISLRRNFNQINLSREAEQRRNNLAMELSKDIQRTPLEDALMIGGAAGALVAMATGPGLIPVAIAAGVGGMDYLAKAFRW